MHRAINGLAMVAVLLHVVGGCCRHHAHTECGERTETLGQMATTCSHHEHEAVAHEGCHGEEPGHPHDHGCDTGKCVFVVPQKDNPVELGPVDYAGSALADRGATSPLRQIAGHAFHSSHRCFPPPLRLHLVNQILQL